MSVSKPVTILVLDKLAIGNGK